MKINVTKFMLEKLEEEIINLFEKENKRTQINEEYQEDPYLIESNVREVYYFVKEYFYQAKNMLQIADLTEDRLSSISLMLKKAEFRIQKNPEDIRGSIIKHSGENGYPTNEELEQWEKYEEEHPEYFEGDAYDLLKRAFKETQKAKNKYLYPMPGEEKTYRPLTKEEKKKAQYLKDICL